MVILPLRRLSKVLVNDRKYFPMDFSNKPYSLISARSQRDVKIAALLNLSRNAALAITFRKKF
jgi:hypothetical protein